MCDSFLTRLLSEVLTHTYAYVPNNIEFFRYPQENSVVGHLKTALLAAMASAGFHRKPGILPGQLDLVLSQSFDSVCSLFADQRSSRLLVELIALRLLGTRHYALSTNTREYWQTHERVRTYRRKAAVMRKPVVGPLDLFDFDGVQLIVSPLALLNVFLLDQYLCKRARIGVREGDTVIDAGACWGDTSLYFARQASTVIACECISSNVALLQRNLAMNPTLAPRVQVVTDAVWDTSGQLLEFEDYGSSSHATGKGAPVRTIAIDDLVREAGLNRVDFIKMDIEGAELNALKGAEQTLRLFRPRLAISVYHSVADLARIPSWIASLNVGYRLYLDHVTIYPEETILFADAGPER